MDSEQRAREGEGADREGGEGGGKGDGSPRDDADDLDRLDPSARHAAHLAAPGGMTAVIPAFEAANAATDAPVRARSLEELLPLLVRKIAWGGSHGLDVESVT